jgi:signal transduction histidine kinase
MSLVRNVGRATVRPVRALGRGRWLGGRGSARGIGWLAGWSSGARDPAQRRRRHVTLVVLAWLVAVVSAFIAFGTAQFSYDIPFGLAPIIGAAVGLPFGLVVSRPLIGWAISVGSAWLFAYTLPLTHVIPWPWQVMHGLVMLALLAAVCARERLPRAVGAWLVTVVLYAGTVTSDQAVGWSVGVSAVAVMGLLAGRLARTNRALAVQAEVSEAERERRVVLEERARIARDLHDIVAHHMSLVVVQAETAPYRVADLSDAARAELDSISASARSALAETRALLAVLRSDGDAAEHAPQPGIGDLDALLDGARRAGVPLTADVTASAEELRPGTSLAAYRIVQVGLANTSRHAAGAAVRVEVVREGETLRVTVVNGPVPGAAVPEPGAPPPREGHGITGMRERVGAEGGTLWTGWTPDGGFAVEALLPLSQQVGTVPLEQRRTTVEGAEEPAS